MLERRITLQSRLLLRATLGGLQQGKWDPTARFEPDRLWRATRTPEGPATQCISLTQPDEIRVQAWGPGAEYLLHHANELVGDHQNENFETDNALVTQLQHELGGLRIPKTRNVWEIVLATVLAQRVTGMEATRAYRGIVKALSEPAPGPGELLLPPTGERVAAMPYYWFHRFGVEKKRADTLRYCGRHAKKLDLLTELTPTKGHAALLKFAGVGPWTAASVALISLGDQDAVPIGDYHFKNHVAWALAGEARASDDRMLELLEPFSGHRGRVLRMLIHGHSAAPKYGARYAPLPIAAY